MTELEQREVLEHVRATEAMAQKLLSIAMTSPFSKDYIGAQNER